MGPIRRFPWAILAAWAALSAGRTASAQYDMLPYQPYTGQYRASTFPADQSNSGTFYLPATPAPRFTGQSFADRLDADLDGGLLDEPPSKADQKVAKDRTLRDKYYAEAQRASDPAERARLMKSYREEDRRLSRGLAARPSTGAARPPAEAARAKVKAKTARPPAREPALLDRGAVTTAPATRTAPARTARPPAAAATAPESKPRVTASPGSPAPSNAAATPPAPR